MTELWQVMAGLVIGLLVAAPIGPVNVICIQRTLKDGPGHGFVIGLGAAVGDAVFGLVAALGLVTISALLVAHEAWFQTAGGLVLIVMGLYAWRAHPHLDDVVPSTGDTARGMAGTFVLTVSNPITALGFVALFTSAGVGLSGEIREAARLVAGVFAGSALWWLIVTRLAALVRDRLHDNHLWWINRGSAILVWIFAAVSLARGVIAFQQNGIMPAAG
ncbi:MAG: LysE family transporter [Sphingomonadales bacterium]